MGIRRKRICAAAVGGSMLLLTVAWYALPFCVQPPVLTPEADNRVYDRHGEFMGVIPAKDGYRHIPLRKLPPRLVSCLTMAEDRRFYSHGGVDVAAILRAAYKRMEGTSRSGASTITMQLAKLSNPPAPRTLRTKLHEALQARRLEYAYSKDELLLAYLNLADFGNNCRGAETAALFYFGKTADELELHEAALLAALVQSPTRLDPLRHPEQALHSRNRILRKLKADTGAPLNAAPHSLNAPPMLHATPGRLTTDATLLENIADIAAEEITLLRKHNASQAAVVVIDNRNGELLAALPTAAPHSLRGGKLNGTIIPRSAGSTLKPFVYLQAFGNGAWPGTIMADVRTLYRSESGIQAPGNYNDCYLGPISMRQALACSQNIPAMDALSYYGGANALLNMLRNLGMDIPGTAEEYGLGLAIGNAHVSLLQLTHAYSTLARCGGYLPLYTHLPHPQPPVQQVLDARHSYQVAHILSDTAARTATFGAAPELRFPFRCAAKTGTSSNFRDNWCIGFTAEYTVGVWVGNFDNTPMRNVSGISGAGPIFHRVMLLLYADGNPATFPSMPHGLKMVETDTRSGTLATADTPATCRGSEPGTEEQLAALQAPKLDAQGRVILNSRYAEWFATCGQEHLYTLDATAPSGRRPTILIPSHGTTVHLDPTLPNGGRIIELRSTLPTASATWSCPTLQLFSRDGHTFARLTPGSHTLRVSTPQGQKAEARFHVVQD